MSVEEQIKEHLAGLEESKRSEIEEIQRIALRVSPGCRVWFDNGKDSEGKTVANPTIGYGFFTIRYANGTTKDFFQIGLSANATGISVYILGLKDKTYLARTFGEQLGKAKVTGYCIRFKKLKDIDLEVLEAAIKFGFENPDV